MDTKVRLLLLYQNLENTPASSPALERRVGQSLAQDGVDDLFPEKKLAAAAIADDAGDGGGGGGALLGVGALQVLDDGKNLFLAEGGQFRVGRWLDGFLQRVLTVGDAAPAPA